MLFVIAGLLAASVLTGAHDSGCTIVVTPNHECVALDDVCPNLQCDVFKSDDDGCALCECEGDEPPPPPPQGCFGDDDCAEGEYCEFNFDEQEPEPAGDGDGDNQEERGIAMREGQCVPLNCDVTNDAAPVAEPLCGPGEEAQWIEDRCGGYFICVPVQQGCLSDDDCGEGRHCELFEACPPCSDQGCDAPCYVEGVCVDDDPGFSCANVDCGPGFVCEDTAGGAQCVPVEGGCDDGGPVFCDMLPPTCEDGLVAAVRNGCYECVDPATCGEEPRGCYSDEECGSDERCNAGDVCEAPPGCDENSGCVTVCYGQCVPLDSTEPGQPGDPDDPTGNDDEPNAP